MGVYIWGVVLLISVTCTLSFAADILKCTERELIGIPGLACVYSNVVWHPGLPQPEFEATNAEQIAFVNSNMTAIPDSLYDRSPQLKSLVVNKINLKELKIKDGMTNVYAEQNRIKQVRIDGGQSLQKLYLRDNPIENISSLANLKALEVLDVGGSRIAESNENTVDFRTFAGMENLRELNLSRLDAHNVQNENNVILAQLQVLDLSGNYITPSSFELDIFKWTPKLEELSLRDAQMPALSVFNIREQIPALKRINIAGNSFKCDFMKVFLQHLKDVNVEVIGVLDSKSENCLTGFEKIEGLCCYVPPHVATIPIMPTMPTIPTIPTSTIVNAPNDPEAPITVTEKNHNEPTPDSEKAGWILTLIIVVSVITAIVLLAVAAWCFYKKRNKQHSEVNPNKPVQQESVPLKSEPPEIVQHKPEPPESVALEPVPPASVARKPEPHNPKPQKSVPHKPVQHESVPDNDHTDCDPRTTLHSITLIRE